MGGIPLNNSIFFPPFCFDLVGGNQNNLGGGVVILVDEAFTATGRAVDSLELNCSFIVQRFLDMLSSLKSPSAQRQSICRI